MNQPISPEYLHAFVDGELAADEHDRVLAQLERDPDFKSRACELRTLKEQVRGAYARLPGESGQAFARRGHPSCNPRMAALAAALLLALGLGAGGGWLARDSIDTPPRIEHLTGLPASYQPVSLSAHADPDRVLLHLDSSDPERLRNTLDLAEKLLLERQGRGELAIVVNTSGLNLLRRKVSPVQARITRLSSHHNNLSFIACGQTISRLKQEGADVSLVSEAHVAPSAISEILRRMQQGWVYVKV